MDGDRHADAVNRAVVFNDGRFFVDLSEDERRRWIAGNAQRRNREDLPYGIETPRCMRTYPGGNVLFDNPSGSYRNAFPNRAGNPQRQFVPPPPYNQPSYSPQQLGLLNPNAVAVQNHQVHLQPQIIPLPQNMIPQHVEPVMAPLYHPTSFNTQGVQVRMVSNNQYQYPNQPSRFNNPQHFHGQVRGGNFQGNHVGPYQNMQEGTVGGGGYQVYESPHHPNIQGAAGGARGAGFQAQDFHHIPNMQGVIEGGGFNGGDHPMYNPENIQGAAGGEAGFQLHHVDHHNNQNMQGLAGREEYDGRNNQDYLEPPADQLPLERQIEFLVLGQPDQNDPRMNDQLPDVEGIEDLPAAIIHHDSLQEEPQPGPSSGRQGDNHPTDNNTNSKQNQTKRKKAKFSSKGALAEALSSSLFNAAKPQTSFKKVENTGAIQNQSSAKNKPTPMEINEKREPKDPPQYYLDVENNIVYFERVPVPRYAGYEPKTWRYTAKGSTKGSRISGVYKRMNPKDVAKLKRVWEELTRINTGISQFQLGLPIAIARNNQQYADFQNFGIEKYGYSYAPASLANRGFVSILKTKIFHIDDLHFLQNSPTIISRVFKKFLSKKVNICSKFSSRFVMNSSFFLSTVELQEPILTFLKESDEAHENGGDYLLRETWENLDQDQKRELAILQETRKKFNFNFSKKHDIDIGAHVGTASLWLEKLEAFVVFTSRWFRSIRKFQRKSLKEKILEDMKFHKTNTEAYDEIRKMDNDRKEALNNMKIGKDKQDDFKTNPKKGNYKQKDIKNKPRSDQNNQEDCIQEGDEDIFMTDVWFTTGYCHVPYETELMQCQSWEEFKKIARSITKDYSDVQLLLFVPTVHGDGVMEMIADGLVKNFADDASYVKEVYETIIKPALEVLDVPERNRSGPSKKTLAKARNYLATSTLLKPNHDNDDIVKEAIKVKLLRYATKKKDNPAGKTTNSRR